MKQVVLMVMLFMVTVVPLGAQEQPVARAVLFWMDGCPHCRQVMEEVMPALADRFGAQLDVHLVEVETADEVDLLFQTAHDLGLTLDEIDVPLLVMGGQVLVGDEIADRLHGMVEEALAAGGVDWPVLLGWPVEPAPEPAEGVPTVAFWLFWGSHCGDCRVLMEGILPPILEGYPKGQVIVHDRDLEKGNYEMQLAFEQYYGIELGPIPQVYIGNEALLGNDEIEARLPGLIDRYLAAGGVDLPPVPALPATGPIPSTKPEGPAVHLAYFASLDCQACDLIKLALDALRDQYAQLVVHEYSVIQDAALLGQLCARNGIRVSRCIAPAAFVGQRGLAGGGLVPSALTTLITDHLAEGADADWEVSAAADGIGSGLLDGRHVGWVAGAVVLLLGVGLWWSAKQGRREQHGE